jgi:hypothetical protein
MNPEAFQIFELISRELWVGDVKGAYNSLYKVRNAEGLDAIRQHDVLFNLAVFSVMVDPEQTDVLVRILHNFYDTIDSFRPEEMRTKKNRGKIVPLSYRTDEINSNMDIEHILTFLLSPHIAKRELENALRRARETKLDPIHGFGRFTYSVNTNHGFPTVKAYSIAGVEVKRIKKFSGQIELLNLEKDLVTFNTLEILSEITAREEGVFLIKIKQNHSQVTEKTIIDLFKYIEKIFFREYTD